MCICTLDVNKGCYIWAQTVMLDDKSLVVDYRRVVLPTVADTIRAVKRKSSSEWLLFLLFVGPNLILFGIFTYWPLIYSFYLSTVRWDLISPRKKPVGLANYEYLWNSDTFRTVMWNSVVFTVGAVGGSMLLGLLSALLLNQKLRGRDTARAIVFMPTLLSGAAIGIVWVYIFDPRYGLMRTILSPLGISSPNWLRDTTWALPAIIIVYVWKNLGFATVIYLAGLQGIPKDLYEAARVDGAGAVLALPVGHVADALADHLLPGDHFDPQLVPVLRHHSGHDARRSGRRDQYAHLLHLSTRDLSRSMPGGPQRPRRALRGHARHHDSRSCVFQERRVHYGG